MEFHELASALLAIVLIDLVLAGDNAIVIALAARTLPPALQRKAVIWGTVGAVVVRTLMTLGVVWLLKVPGLLAAGGVLLLWIAYRLLLPEPARAHGEGSVAAAGFWGAMRTIVVADAVMGLDNVLAVAGAAHGNMWLVVAGLVISVPIMVWGSTLVLSLVERYPAITYLGAAVLCWTAVKMVGSEPLVAPWLAGRPVIDVLMWLAIPVVLWAGFLARRRANSRSVGERLAQMAPQRPAAGGEAEAPAAPQALRVLVPVDGSVNALHAVRHVIAEYRRQHALEVHLLNVQRPLARHVARFLSRRDLAAWHAERAEQSLAGARQALEAAGVPYQAHQSSGERAPEICRMARALGVHHIVMGSARHNSLTRLFEDSVTSDVLEHTPVPVEVVAGEALSRWERWGVPAGALAASGMLLLAID